MGSNLAWIEYRMLSIRQVTTRRIEEYMSQKSGVDLSKVFDQYLRDYRIPEFTYSSKGNQLKYKWNNTVDGFNMPIKVTINGETKSLQPTDVWKTVQLEVSNPIVKVDENYYVTSKKLD